MNNAARVTIFNRVMESLRSLFIIDTFAVFVNATYKAIVVRYFPVALLVDFDGRASVTYRKSN